MANKTLGEMIEWLGTQDQNKVVAHGFGSPHSDRGDYSNLAFKPEPTARIGDMLEFARSARGHVFQGYKGGEFKMYDHTEVLIGHWGECGENITDTHFKYWGAMPAVPAGFKLVPVEPTEAMMEAWIRTPRYGGGFSAPWEAMLAAAPSPGATA